MAKDTERALHLVEEICSNLSAVDGEDLIDELSEQMLSIFKRSDVKETDFFVLRDVAHIICGKLAFSHGLRLKTNTIKLYEFLKQNKFVSGIFEKHIEEKFDIAKESVIVQKKNLRTHKLVEIDPAACAKQIAVSLRQLLNTSAKANAIDKNLGFTLLDLEGNFLLLCKKSRHLFGIKNTETKVCNFFDLMIPYSKLILAAKFGNEMFQGDRLVKSSRNFNYVIFSKTALKKFYNTLKTKKIETKEQLEVRLRTLENSEQGMDLYNAYLTALTSCATIVTIKYSEAEILNLADQKLLFRKNFKLFESDFISKQFVKQSRAEPADAQPPAERMSFEAFREPGSLPQAEPDGPGRVPAESLQPVYSKCVILLKTRYSKNVPAFNYQDLKEQPTIVNFKNYLKGKMFGAEDKTLAAE